MSTETDLKTPLERFGALTDAEMLTELRDLHEAILERLWGHAFYGLDPDDLNKPPALERLDAGVSFAAKVDALADRFLSGPVENDVIPVSLNEWTVGLRAMQRELQLNAAAVTVGLDPRDGHAL